MEQNIIWYRLINRPSKHFYIPDIENGDIIVIIKTLGDQELKFQIIFLKQPKNEHKITIQNIRSHWKQITHNSKLKIHQADQVERGCRYWRIINWNKVIGWEKEQNWKAHLNGRAAKAILWNEIGRERGIRVLKRSNEMGDSLYLKLKKQGRII